MDNIKEIKPQERYWEQNTALAQEQWMSQQWYDYKRLRNRDFWTKKDLINDTVYYTKVAWRVIASAENANNYAIRWYNDRNSSPTTVVWYAWINLTAPNTWVMSITFPVYANSYYKVVSWSWLSLWYFIPL